MYEKSKDKTIQSLQKRIQQLEDQIANFERTDTGPNRTTQTYVSVLNNVPLAVLNIDKEGYITIANDLVNSLFDLSDSYFNEKLHFSKFQPIEETPLPSKIEKLIKLDIPFDDEIPMCFSGNQKHYRVRGVPMKGAEGQLLSYLVIIGDITKRKIAELQLIHAKEKAEESNKLKTAFLTNMSHEIRTPMNHIIGFLDIILETELTEEEKHEYKGIVESSSAILLRKIDDIIDIARIESKQMKIINEEVLVGDIMNRIYRINNELLQKNKEIQINFKLKEDKEAQAAIIQTDQLRLQQILNNLIDNAFKFTEKGEVELGCYEGGDGDFSFYVKDTGIGIDKEHYGKIFEHFSQVDYSTTRKVDGSGLGLAISQGLVELMGGVLSVDSKAGEGSVFTITLSKCVVGSMDGRAHKKKAIPKALSWSTKHILIVEDDHFNFELLKVFLRDTGVRISRAKNGMEAIQMTRAEQPNLILMDIQLPEINGFDASKAIKGYFPEIPIVAQTAYANNNETEMARNAGIDSLISKPISKNSLLNNLLKFMGDFS